MNMAAEITKEEFMELPTEQVKRIVENKGIPKVGVLIPDGTRKSAAFFYNMDLNIDNFEEKLFKKINNELMKVIEIMFSHGLKTLLIPSFTHGNLRRTKKYVDSALSIGFKYILNDQKWYNFYDEYDIKVKVYGNLNLVKNMGYDYVINWINKVQEYTSSNKSHRLYFGLACSNKYEIPRIIEMCTDFYIREKRYPSLEEKIEMYYSDLISDVDFLIRPTIIRDSDIQPPLISGDKSQMYFPVFPFVFITEKGFREIIYDLIFSRTITYGLDDNDLNAIKKEDADWLKKYYELNRKSIIGIGKKIGNIWVPIPQIKMNKPEKR